MICRGLLMFLLVFCCATAWGDGPADNLAKNVRRIPKQGIEVPDDVRTSLAEGLAQLAEIIKPLQRDAQAGPYLPDVLVYYKAVQDALQYQEFFDAKELQVAQQLLGEAEQRAFALQHGKTPWLDKPGPIVRGYISKIDGSVQPYGLVIPATLDRKSPHRHRLDFWFHGRGETLSELNFVNDRRQNPGQFTPEDTIVLHPYGRYCNANKFAGEIDSLEALAAVQRDFRIDDDRISVRGFSMGGAACWQFAVHYTDRWFAAAPGAGFSETPDFLKVFQKESLAPTWYEQKLWRWYDCTDYALNLANLPTIAYSGEKDSQKQAADVMAAALHKEGIELAHIIGPDTAHAYQPEAKAEIDRRMNALAKKGRQSTPHHVRFTTYTLRYNRMHWIEVEGLEQHWEKAVVDARMKPANSTIDITTKNVSELTIRFPAGAAPFDVTKPVRVTIDGTEIAKASSASDEADSPERFRVSSDGSLVIRLRKNETWSSVTELRAGLAKAHGLQGPIDDAFMDSFLFVRPTGQPANAQVGKWAEAELTRASEHWRRHFRGVARVKDDKDVTKEDIQSHHLILWGDPASNTLLGEIAKQLPIKWTSDNITAGDREFPAADHALIAIFPNPQNPSRYVVLNSSFTFRDYAYLNNARQVAKLPDWAVVDVRKPPDALWPGKIVDADFFDEQWQYQESPERQR